MFKIVSPGAIKTATSVSVIVDVTDIKHDIPIGSKLIDETGRVYSYISIGHVRYKSLVDAVKKRNHLLITLRCDNDNDHADDGLCHIPIGSLTPM